MAQTPKDRCFTTKMFMKRGQLSKTNQVLAVPGRVPSHHFEGSENVHNVVM